MAQTFPWQSGKRRIPSHLVGNGAGIAAHPVTLAGNLYCPLAAPFLLRKRGI